MEFVNLRSMSVIELAYFIFVPNLNLFRPLNTEKICCDRLTDTSLNIKGFRFVFLSTEP